MFRKTPTPCCWLFIYQPPIKFTGSRAYCYGPMTGYIKPNLSNSLLDSLLSLDFLKVLCFSFPVPLNSRSWKILSSTFEEMGHEFPFWNIPSGKTCLPFQMFRCSRKFTTGTTTKVLFQLLSDQIFRKGFVNSKEPLSLSWGRKKRGRVPGKTGKRWWM